MAGLARLPGPISPQVGSYDWKFQPCFRDEKRPNILARSSGAKCEKESKHGQTQKSLLSHLLIAASLQLNGMLTMWKIQQAMQEAGPPEFIPAAFNLCNRAEVFVWQNFQPA